MCSKCDTLEQKCGKEQNMEKENVGKGKERVLRRKFCNCVSEEQNVERGRKGFCVKNFVTVFQKGFHKRSRLKRLWIWALWWN